MNILFTPEKIGNIELPNRFAHSATYEGMAKGSGEVSDELIKRYEKLAKGGVGLIIPGYMGVHSTGRAYPYQIGIDSDEMIPGLKTLADTVHRDFISMSRPFIREPFLVNKIKEGKMDRVSCVSCNRCLAAIPNDLPIYCYNKGFPK